MLVATEDVIDGDVDGDAAQPDLLAKCGSDLPLDVAGYLMYRVPVGHGNGEVHDCGAAEHARGGVRMTVPEGGLLGQRGDLFLGAATERNADARDEPGAVPG